MCPRHFTCFPGCIGASNIALVITSIFGVPFLVSRCFQWDTCSMRSQSDTPNQSQASLQARRAPPVGRVLRIVLGLALMVYVTPVYFQVPVRVAVGSLLLMLGLIGVYSLIHIVVSRRLVPFGPASSLSSRWGYSSGSRLPVLPGYRFLAAARVSWQRSPCSVSRWWLLACAPLRVAK